MADQTERARVIAKLRCLMPSTSRWLLGSYGTGEGISVVLQHHTVLAALRLLEADAGREAQELTAAKLACAFEKVGCASCDPMGCTNPGLSEAVEAHYNAHPDIDFPAGWVCPARIEQFKRILATLAIPPAPAQDGQCRFCEGDGCVACCAAKALLAIPPAPAQPTTPTSEATA